MKALAIFFALATWQFIVAAELKFYRSRVEITADGRCNCSYLTLSHTPGWADRSDWGPGHRVPPYQPSNRYDLFIRREIAPDLYRFSIDQQDFSPERTVRLAPPASVTKPATRLLWPRHGSKELQQIYDNRFVFALIDHAFIMFPIYDKALKDTVQCNKQFPASPASPDCWALYYTSDRRYVVSYRIDGRPFLFDPAGGGLLKNEVTTLSIYGAESKERVITLTMKSKGQSLRSREAFDRATYVDNRFVIFPATPGREIVYVCDLESDNKLK